MIWRLTYCNKEGVQARLDIIKGSSTPIEVIEGTVTPFVLNYKMDKPDKSGFFMTSSADISIFETTSFNIDSLKTSSETEIKVEHYIDNILDWAGFVIPDFFSKTIGSPATVEMVASDRLATLKGVTLTDLNQYVSMRDLAVACLAHTGLSLPLYTLADFGNEGQTNAFFKALGLSSRLSDTKGRNISCYDILKSILVASNSKLAQQDGAWHIVNKWQHEQGAGNLFSNLTSSTPYSEQTINFSDVHVGGRRSIVPVAAITGVYHEFGGGRSYPDNFDFRDFGLIPEFNFPGWTKAGTFNVARGDKEIIGYSFDGQMQFGANTVDSYFFNSNVFNTSNYLQMDGVPVPYTTGQIEVVLDLNATAQTVSQFLTNVTAVKIAVGAVKDGSPTIWLNNNGIFAEDNAVVHNLNFDRGATYEAQTKGFNLKGVINNPEGYSIIMRIYGSRDEGEDNRRQIAIHFARIEFKNTQDAPKGIIYKRKQGTDFTKEHDIDTTIFGDYMRKGLDGYFYEYPFDDTSSLYRIAGTLTQPLWTAPNDAEQLPLLHHITRQKSRMFSLAHNMISARINVSSFKPLNIFIDCNSERHVVVSATYDFLRSEVEVELEQIAYATLDVRDFIYSYFGDGESGISSVGGISGGGGGGSTGGGLTPEQLEILSFWKKDPDRENTIFTEMNAYSKLELSAYGAGDGGGGGGSDYERLDTWADYESSKAGWVLSAFLGNDLNTRVTNLENSSGGGSVTSVGISVPAGLSVSNSPITSSGVIEIGLQAGYSIPTTAKQGQWDAVVTDFAGLEIGGRNYFSVNDFVADNKARGYSTIEVIQHEGNIAYRSTNITNNHNVPRYLQGKFEANTQYYLKFNILWESFTDSGAEYIFTIRYTDGSSSTLWAYTSHTTRSLLTTAGKTIDYITTTRQYNGTVVIYNIQIKKENKLSDWTPAPEDQVSDWNTTDVNSLSFIKNKPTTLAGYGITDAYTKTEVNSALISKLDKSVFDDLFEKVEVSTGVFAIKAKYNFYGVGEVSAYGIGSGGGGGSGIIETVYGYGNLGQTFNNATLTDTFNAYTINQINTRLVAVENGSATTVNTTGTGNAITSISKDGSVITAYKSGSFLPLTGGTMANTNLVTNLNADLLDGYNADQASVPSTIAVRDSNRAISMSSVKYSPISINISTQGWYRVYAGYGSVENVIINIARNYAAINDESYSFSISKAYNSPPSIVQISGRANVRLITYIRVDYTTSAMYIDFFFNSNIAHGVFVSGLGRGEFQSPTLVSTPSGSVTEVATTDGVSSNFGFTGSLSGNALSATKLQTARTIAGISFDGTANIAIPFANLTSKPTTLGGYGITDAVTLNTAQTITGDKIFEGGLSILSSYSYFIISRIGGNNKLMVGADTSQNAIYSRDLGTGASPLRIVVGTTEVMKFSNDYNVGIGTPSPSQKLHVVGNILATGTTTTTKVIFNAAGWSMEQVGSELQMKHNNVLKMRFTSAGSIVATEEITAHG